MANFFTDNDDLRFYFDQGVPWAELVELTEYGFRAPDGFKDVEEAKSFYRDVAESFGELAAEVVAPRAARLDVEHSHIVDGQAEEAPALREISEAMRAAELHKLCVPRELGGLNAPLTVYMMAGELLARADVSIMTHFSFHGGMALAALAFSIREGSTTFDVPSGRIARTRFAEMIREIASGEAWGCMDITEPNAGSDMAQLRTRAEQDADGAWRVSGQKIFITSGHGKWHFVIARTEEAKDPSDPYAGLAGLSMFLVKAYDTRPDGTCERYVTLDRFEEKLGHHGSVTASLSFDRVPAELIGKRGEGFRAMLLLMNNARVGVAFESIGLAEAAYRAARDYAEVRTSMGKPIARHEMIADMLEEMELDIIALRALAVRSAYHEECAQKLGIFQGFFTEASPEERARVSRELPRHQRMSRRYTPLLKYLASEKAVEIARRAVQIHGGSGYTRDYPVEKLLRDALVLPIYEGTSQIQSLMAMKDTLMGVIARPQAFVRRMADARVRSLSSRDPLDRALGRLSLQAALATQHLLRKTAEGKLRSLSGKPLTSWPKAFAKDWNPKKDFAYAMLHAERLTRLLADEAIAELLVEQAKAHPERRVWAERWLERAEPRGRALYDAITTTGDRLLQRLAEEGRTTSPSVAAAEE
ncbi:MAG: acyl-CoA dehydrogenase family protein [Myxococcales bacterium]|nr:acyl-CoA dehydrogenase family protein [Myxococcales bacterium]